MKTAETSFKSKHNISDRDDILAKNLNSVILGLVTVLRKTTMLLVVVMIKDIHDTLRIKHVQKMKMMVLCRNMLGL